MANDLTISKNNLPSKPEGLHKFIVVGKEVLKAHKAKIRALERINESYTVKRVALKDAQYIADALLEAEKKFGEILARIPKEYKSCSGTILGFNDYAGNQDFQLNFWKSYRNILGGLQFLQCFLRDVSVEYIGIDKGRIGCDMED